MQFSTKDGNVMMSGFATKNAEMRFVGKDQSTAMATFSLAVGKRKDESTIFVDFVAFGKIADYAGRIIKGDNVFVVGAIQERKYTNKNGEERTSKNVLCDFILTMDTEYTAPKTGVRSFYNNDLQTIYDRDIGNEGFREISNKQNHSGKYVDEDLPF